MRTIKKVVIIPLISLFFCLTAFASSPEVDALIGENSREIGGLEEFVPEEGYEIYPGFDAKSVVEGAVTGNGVEESYTFLQRLVDFFFGEFRQAVSSSAALLAIIILSAVLNALSSSFLSDESAKVGNTVCVICAGGLALSKMARFIGLGVASIEDLTMFVQVMVPTMVTFFIGGGRFASAGMFQPAVFMAAQLVATLIKSFFLPLIYIYLILIIADAVLPKRGLDKVSGIFKNIFSWSLGVLLTVFTAVISIGGSMLESVDNVAVRALKFSVGTFVPVVGKILSDSTDMVVASSMLLKNAFGILGIVIAVLICVAPVLRIAAQIAVFKLAAAFSEPFSGESIGKLLGGFSSALTMVLSLSASMALVVIISIAIMVKSGGVA